MDKVFLHIGYPKSASTSLQVGYFGVHPDIFFLGPYSGGINPCYYNEQVKIAIEVDLRLMKDFGYDEDRARSVFNSCYDDFVKSGRRIMGVSSESLSFTMHHDIDVTQKAQRLQRLFPKARVLIVVRNQFDLLRSMYKELVTSGFSRTYSQYVEDIFYNRARSIVYDINYLKMVDIYTDLFGPDSVTVVPMEWLRTSPPMFYHRISDGLGISSEFKVLPTANESLDDAFYLALRDLNARHRYMFGVGLTEPVSQSRYPEYFPAVVGSPERGDAILEPKIAELLWTHARNLSRGLPDKIDYAVPEGIYGWLYEHYATSNDALADATGLPLAQLGYPTARR